MQYTSGSSDLENARARLRAEQHKASSAEGLARDADRITDAALEHLDALTRFIATTDPQVVRRGAFRYNRTLEEERIARARSLILRVAPGPFEDPNYFAMLAYQAASVEMAFDQTPAAGTRREQFSKFLLGTVGAPDVNAFAKTVDSDNHTIVVLFSGLVDFIYQAAKVVVEALHFSRGANKPNLVTARIDIEAVRARLTTEPGPAERLYRTLEAYCYRGYPRASSFERVPEEQNPPLSLLVAMAERWVIGHEYGHGVEPSFKPAPAGVNTKHAAEYFADFNATIVTVLSASKLDSVPPEFPLAGGFFALACLDILHRSFSTVYSGMDTGLEDEQQTHPTCDSRAAMAIGCFRQYFDVAYHPDGSFDLNFVLRPEAPQPHGFTIEHDRRARVYADVLKVVWQPVRERLVEDFRAGRRLHARWR